MSLPYVVWVPLGALAVSVSAFLWCFYFSWANGTKAAPLEAKWAWRAQYALYAAIGSLNALLVGLWWSWGPWPI